MFAQMKTKIQNLINEYEKRIIAFQEIDAILFKEVIDVYSSVIEDLKFILMTDK